MQFEPYRIKVVEPIALIGQNKRWSILTKAYFNPFLIPAQYVTIDLISDSGTSAMSSNQWSQFMAATESFAFQESYYYLIETARKITGFQYILPVHQGRAAEHILFKYLLNTGELVVGNNFFETTEENIKSLKAVPLAIPGKDKKFPGNINLDMLNKLLRTKRIKIILLTITSNINGGQPVSLENIKVAAQLANRYKAILLLDACRFAENGYLNKELGAMDKFLGTIVREIFDQADYIYLSNKKDGLSNTGGFIGLRHKKDFDLLNEKILLYEGFPSHGGNAGRDLVAMAQGLREAIDEDHHRFRISQIKNFGVILKKSGLPLFEPVGGHALVIKTDKIKIPFAAYALAAGVYLEGGVRGGVFGNDYRLAVPRRVYTNDHLAYAASIINKVFKRGNFFKLQEVYRPRQFFNFWVRFKLSGVCRGTGNRGRQKAE